MSHKRSFLYSILERSFKTLFAYILEQTLQLIATRRNQIAHEADVDDITHSRRPITRKMVSDSIDFIENLGNSIYKCVTSSDCIITK